MTSERQRIGAVNVLAAIACAWAAVMLTHWPLLRLPYYWDEAGYYVPAAFDFLRTGSLVPRTTLSNAHPPLPSVMMAAAWKLFGFRPVVTRVLASLMSGAALVAVYRIARMYAAFPVAGCVASLTAVYPVWFAQSTLAHADVFAAAFTLWGLALFADDLQAKWPALLCFALAGLAKETAVVTPFALALWSLMRNGEWRGELLRQRALQALLWLTPALPLACWYAYHRAKTGFMFGNPEFLRYNATDTWHLSRILFALVQRAWDVCGHMELFVPLLFTLVVWLFAKHKTTSGDNEKSRGRTLALSLVFVANLLFFSVMGGALLTRYLLPLYPLVLLFHVAYWQRNTRWWPAWAGCTAVAFVVGWTANPPYGFAAEDNLAYRDSVVLAQDALAHLSPVNASDCVLTAWPVSDDLRKPELGYSSTPVPVVALDDLTAESLLRAQSRCTYAIVFSANPAPGRHAWSLRGKLAETNEQYFNAHDNVPPAAAAHLLGMQVLWQEQRNGQWIAVLGRAAPVLDARNL